MKTTKRILAIVLAMMMALGVFAVSGSALVPAHIGTLADNSQHELLAQACGVTVPEFWEIYRLVVLLNFKASIRRIASSNYFCDGSEVLGANAVIIEGLLPFVKDIGNAHGATSVSDPRMAKLAYIAPAYRSGQLLADVRAAQAQLERLLGVNPDKAQIAELANAFCSAMATKEGDYDEYPVPPNTLSICPICTQYNPASSCRLIDISSEIATFAAMVDFCTANHNSIRYWFIGDPTEPSPVPPDDPPPAKTYIKLWGKQTTWESSFLNWLLCIFCFGWLWMK